MISPPPKHSTEMSSLQGILENVKPRHQGLRASSLLETSTSTSSQLQAKRNEFEREIAEEQLEDADDPLEPFCRYVRWIQDAFPQGQSSESNLINTLERATRAFKDDPRYRNDPRYLRLWLAYAECVDEPRDIFLYLEANGIGQELALFYEEFSLLWESFGRLDCANAAYVRGIERKAKPFDRLQRRYAEFQRRAAFAERHVPEEPADSRRGLALTDPWNSEDAQRSSAPMNGESTLPEKIQVYRDSEGSASEDLPSRDPGPWRDIGTVMSRNKENQLQAEKWSGNALPQRATKVTAKPIEKIEVYRDEQTAAEPQRPTNGKQDVLRPSVVSQESLSRDPLRNFQEATKKALALPKKAAKKPEQSAYPQELLQSSDGSELTFEELRAAVYWRKEEEPRAAQMEPVPMERPMEERRRPPTPTMTITTKEALADIMGMFQRPMAQNEEEQELLTGNASFDSEDTLPDDMIEKTCTIIEQLPVQKLVFEKIQVFRDDQERSSSSAADSKRPLPARKPLGTKSVSEEAKKEEGAVDREPPSSDAEHLEDSPLRSKTPTADPMKLRTSRKLSFGIPKCSSDSLSSNENVTEEDSKKLQQLAFSLLAEDEDLTTFQDLPSHYQSTPSVSRVDPSDVAPRETILRSKVDIMTPIAEVSAEYRSMHSQRSSNRSNTTIGSLPTPLLPVQEESGRDILDHTFHSRFAIPDLDPLATDSTMHTVKNLTKNLRLDIEPVVSTESKEQAETVVEWPHRWMMDNILDAVDFSAVQGYHCASTRMQRKDQIRGTIDRRDLYDLALDDQSGAFLVEQSLGSGGYADVYLVSAESDDLDVDDRKAMKVQSPPCAWEFYILKQLEVRLQDRPAALRSIVCANQMYLFEDESYLLMDYLPEGSLLHHVNRLFQQQNGMEELLAIFFAIELLRTLLALHSVGIIHGDVKPDNIMVRLRSKQEWSSRYEPSGANGWLEKGIVLVDFGKSVDTLVFQENVRFQCSWKEELEKSSLDLLEEAQRSAWLFDLDYVGAAGVIYCMLFGKYLPSHESPLEWIEGQSWKRYWQKDIWMELFQALLPRNESSLDRQASLKACQHKMETYLVEHCERNGKSLKALLRHLETHL